MSKQADKWDWVRTWMIEQVPVILNLIWMVWWMGGFSVATPWRTLVDVWTSAGINLLGWKAMSIASRQQEANKGVGITDHRLECWRAAENVSAIAQVLNVFRGIAFAASPPHFIHFAMVTFYRWYRKWYVARREAGRGKKVEASDQPGVASEI